MHLFMQLTLFAALVLFWLLLDRIKQRKLGRMRNARQRKQSGKEF